MVAAGRRGKYLVSPLDSGDAVMIHLRMTGQLLLVDPSAPRPAHTHVALTLAPDPTRRLPAQDLLFVDPRTFGEVVVFDPDHAGVEVPELARLGLDPIADEWGPAELAAVLRGRTTHLKPLLLDQHRIAGIGNIYADEVLHAAGLHPDTPAGLLRRRDTGRLHGEIVRILTAAIGAGGSTLGDAQYVDLMGAGGSYQNEHRVYGRAGQRCPTCGRGVVRRLIHNGRSTHFCPVCQRLPRRSLPARAADRTGARSQPRPGRGR
jgi:formamidopyrimidine-DNA glycosylase